MIDLTIIIPAAGMSSRMRGRDKLLMEVGGEPLLFRQTKAALATGHPVIVALPRANAPRHSSLKALAVQIAEIADVRLGMGASIAAAARMAKPGRLMILDASSGSSRASFLSVALRHG